MADKLPDEIWLKILRYTSLEDRIRNIQFCCKRFQRLCADNAITRNLDFSKTVFLPEGMCLNAINKAQEHISRLSFKGCHWLNSSLFMDLPHLPALETLNIVYCFLDLDHILKLLREVPNLKNLALSLPVEQMERLRSIKENFNEVWPKIQLQRLHVHIYREEKERDASSFGRYNKMQIYPEWVYLLFFPDKHTECLSVEINDSHIYYDFAKFSATVADFSRRTREGAFFSDKDCEDFCWFTRQIGLHAPLDPLIAFVKINLNLEISRIKYLRLPEFEPDMILSLNATCDGALPPESLPSLEYLLCSCNFTSTCSFECYDKLTNGIILDCQLPNLKYLHFTAWERPPIEFYTRISSMKKLKELDLGGPFDLISLLKSIQSLSRLESLVFSFDEEDNALGFLEGLVIAAPKLRKLKVKIPKGGRISHILYPIHNLQHLDSLDIFSRCELGDANAFCDVLKQLRHLKSVTLQVRGEIPYNFSNIIHKALKFLPNLVQLTLSSKEPTPMQDVLKAVKECKKLEKLWIEDLYMFNRLESLTPISLLEEVITSLPKLYLMAVFTRRFPDNITECVTELRAKLLQDGRKIALYCEIDCDDSLPEIFQTMNPCPETWPVLPLDCF